MFFLEISSEKSDLKMVIWESDLRKPPSRAEFSKGTWFLRRLSLKLFKNHILFGNRLWKVRFEHGDLRKWFEKTTFTSRILKRNVVFEEIKPQYTQKQRSFWKSDLKRLKSQIWKWWFEKTRISIKYIKFSNKSTQHTQQNISFGNLYIYIHLLPEMSDLNLVIWENHLHQQNSQKECGFRGD